MESKATSIPPSNQNGDPETFSCTRRKENLLHENALCKLHLGLSSFPEFDQPRSLLLTMFVSFCPLLRLPRDRDANIMKLLPGNFAKERSQVRISLQDGVPHAEPVARPFDSECSGTTLTHEQEQYVWELAGILFDDYDDEFTEDVPADQQDIYRDRIRKDRLSAFWSALCRNEALAAVTAAPNAEERAIAYLSMNQVVDACKSLSKGKNYRLATLVAQIGGDKVMHEEMADQINEWRRLNVLSEMNESIRTLYELLAGNPCVCEGKKGPLEDRTKTFLISENSKMSWRRAFGLRLWYATLCNEPVDVAINKFAKDLRDRETAKPFPWFQEENRGSHLTRAWEDTDPDSREDVLWGVLKLFAERSSSNKSTSLIKVVEPQNIAGNPFTHRLSFELYNALIPHLPEQKSDLAADQLVLSYAVELKTAGKWLWALFILLYLSNPDQRQKAIQAHLAEGAASIDERDVDLLETLFTQFLIPEPWVWEAKALYARSVEQDHTAEVRFLLRARNWNEAHRTLCAVVGPWAIIEHDHDTLSAILGGFAHDEKPHDWRTGGQVYVDYLHLLKAEAGPARSKLISHLLRALSEMAAPKKGKLGFLQKVSVQEMSAVVGEIVAKTENVSFRLE